jgi:hypothetical protein
VSSNCLVYCLLEKGFLPLFLAAVVVDCSPKQHVTTVGRRAVLRLAGELGSSATIVAVQS